MDILKQGTFLLPSFKTFPSVHFDGLFNFQIEILKLY